MIPLSFSTNAFTRCPAGHAVEKIAAVGYGGVEILADVPHLFAPNVGKPEIRRLQQIIADTGIRVANINANTAMGYYGRQFWEPLFEPSISSPDPTGREWRMDYTRRCIEIAVELGSPCVSITSGKPVPGCPLEKSTATLLKSLEKLTSFAGSAGIRLGIEYEPGLLVESCSELAEVLAAVDSPWLGANLDLGHSHVAGEDPAEVIARLGKNIFHIHLEDIRDRKHFHLIPGEGDIDFRLLFDLLEANGYEGFATVELYTYPQEPERAARAALAHLLGLRDTNKKGMP